MCRVFDKMAVQVREADRHAGTAAGARHLDDVVVGNRHRQVQMHQPVQLAGRGQRPPDGALQVQRRITRHLGTEVGRQQLLVVVRGERVIGVEAVRVGDAAALDEVADAVGPALIGVLQAVGQQLAQAAQR